MRQTAYTPEPTQLEIRPEQVTTSMEKQYNSIWAALTEHEGEWHDAGWWRTNRQKGLIQNNLLRYTLKGSRKYNPLHIELIPQSILRYSKDGIRGEDIMVLWCEDDHQFVPMTFSHYDQLYNRVMEEVEIRDISDRMIDQLGQWMEDNH